MDDLIDRLRNGVVEHAKRWSGDTHDDLGGSADYAETDAIMSEAAAALTEAQATIARQQVLLNRALESNGDMQITIARLEAALKQIEEQDDDGDMMYHALGPLAKIARAALSPGKGE